MRGTDLKESYALLVMSLGPQTGGALKTLHFIVQQRSNSSDPAYRATSGFHKLVLHSVTPKIFPRVMSPIQTLAEEPTTQPQNRYATLVYRLRQPHFD